MAKKIIKSEKIVKNVKKVKRSFLELYKKREFLLRLYKPTITKVKEFLKHYGLGLYNRIDQHHILLLAGGLAFSMFICIIPFVLILFWALGIWLDSSTVELQISTLIDAVIPYQTYADFVKEKIYMIIGDVIKYKNIAGIIGGIGLLFAASGLFSSMRTILNTVFSVDKEQSFLIEKLKDFGLILMVILLFFAATIILPIIDVFRNSAKDLEFMEFFRVGIFEQTFFMIISIIVIFVLFSILYFSVPTKRLNKKSIFVSALWAAVLWEVAKQGFGYYIYNFATYGKIYGAYAVLVVVAFWIYYSAVVFIVGGEIGRLFYERNYLTPNTKFTDRKVQE